MPEQREYPGIEVGEIPGAGAIPGVPTSITAFVGRTRRGPTDRAVAVSSYAEFERVYGGPWEHSALPSSVRDFFTNGGTAAVGVRLYRPESGDGARPARARLVIGTLELEAADEGEWGNALRVRIDHDAPPGEGPAGEPRFTLSVRDGRTGAIEVFPGLSMSSADARFVTAVVAAQSRLVRVTSAGQTRPAATAGPADGAVDVWADTTPPTNVTVADDARATDGQILDDDSFVGPGLEAAERGLYLLEQADLVNLLVIPPYTADGAVGIDVVAAAAAYSEERRAVLLVDPAPTWRTVADVLAAGAAGFENTLGTTGSNAALFYPGLRRSTPMPGEPPETVAPSGAVAGVIARTDGERGVWHAPAGTGAMLAGVDGLALALSDGDIGRLTPIGVNALRVVPGAGPVIWGARTLYRGGDTTPEWTYLPVRRLALFIEESLDRGTRWAVFEPNDEALWARIRLDVGGFLATLFRRGAFTWPTPQEAYLVRCDGTTTTQADVDRGIVNVVVGFAPLRPAEFVVIRLQQLAGQPCDG
jgi:phage tail sheath protein FI